MCNPSWRTPPRPPASLPDTWGHLWWLLAQRSGNQITALHCRHCGVSMSVRSHVGDGSGDTKINHPVPRYYTKEGQIRFLGFHGTVQGRSFGATFQVSVCLGIQQRLWTLSLGACLLFGSSRCCTQQHPASLPVNLCQSFAHGKNIVVDNVLADKPDVKTWQDNVTESLSCYKREVKRWLFLH